MKSSTEAHDHRHDHHGAGGRSDEAFVHAHAHPGPAATAGGEQHQEHHGHDRHAGHSVEMFRDRFWITLFLSIPTLVWSSMVQQMVGFRAPAFPGSQYVPALFGTAVYLYGGLVFVNGGLRSYATDFQG